MYKTDKQLRNLIATSDAVEKFSAFQLGCGLLARQSFVLESAVWMLLAKLVVKIQLSRM